MHVQDVMQPKRRVVHTISEQRTAEDAIVQMTEQRTSALIVMDGEMPVGIFTERDVLRCHVAWRQRLFRETTTTKSHRSIDRSLRRSTPDHGFLHQKIDWYYSFLK